MKSRIVLRALRAPAVAAVLAVLTTSVAGAAISPSAPRRPAPGVRVYRSSATTAAARWKPPTGPRLAASPRGVAQLLNVHVEYMPVVTDAARRRALGTCTPEGAGGPDYALEGWKVPGPLTAHLNVGTVPGGLSAASAFQAAFSAWAAVGAPSISVATDSQATSPSADGVDELMFGHLGGSTLAITYTWRWSNGAVESDVVFNSGPWFNAPGEGNGCYPSAHAYDLQDVATHEFGHLLGLGHATARSDRFNTMYPTAALGETCKRSPKTGDAAGIHAIYG